jgi:hypothetical protein
MSYRDEQAAWAARADAVEAELAQARERTRETRARLELVRKRIEGTRLLIAARGKKVEPPSSGKDEVGLQILGHVIGLALSILLAVVRYLLNHHS